MPQYTQNTESTTSHLLELFVPPCSLEGFNFPRWGLCNPLDGVYGRGKQDRQNIFLLKEVSAQEYMTGNSTGAVFFQRALVRLSGSTPDDDFPSMVIVSVMAFALVHVEQRAARRS